jgi:hypothetical protein
MKMLTGALVGLVMLAGCSSAGTDAAQPTPSPTFVVPTSEAPEPEPIQADPADLPLETDDFEVDVKTLSKQCFGSAGCSVDVRLELAIAAEAAQDRAAEITVSVAGDESGEIIETISVDSDGQYSPPEVSLSTPRSSTKVTATVTDVTEV